MLVRTIRGITENRSKAATGLVVLFLHFGANYLLFLLAADIVINTPDWIVMIFDMAWKILFVALVFTFGCWLSQISKEERDNLFPW